MENKFEKYVLKNANGMKMEVTNFGGRVVSLFVPDKNGKLGDIVLGYDSLEEYLTGNPYFGAMIGRYGNRIAKGKFSLNGKTYQLEKNNGENNLHGGSIGFHNVFWKKIASTDSSITLNYLSKDGDENFPGNLNVNLTYSLSDKNELVIDYEATADETTVVNLTHHSFFNLAGEDNGSILDHELIVYANEFTPVDSSLIPTGELRSVKNTPFDFTTPRKIGERINQDEEQLNFGKGYDHNFVLNKNGNEFSLAAKVYEQTSGRIMEVWTTEPGMQLYTGNFLGDEIGKNKKRYPLRSAFCLETQHFPDSPNQEKFPSTILNPQEKYQQKTVYKFDVKR